MWGYWSMFTRESPFILSTMRAISDGAKPYGDWYYDLEKFSFFSKAALSALPVIGLEPDVIHCHDWQTGLIPVYLKGQIRRGRIFPWNQIRYDDPQPEIPGRLGCEDDPAIFRCFRTTIFTPDKLEAYKDGNMLKGGLVYADAITTVSNTYAEEIKTPFYGEGLDGLMRARANEPPGYCKRHRLRRYSTRRRTRYRPELQCEEFPKGKSQE